MVFYGWMWLIWVLDDGWYWVMLCDVCVINLVIGGIVWGMLCLGVGFFSELLFYLVGIVEVIEMLWDV